MTTFTGPNLTDTAYPTGLSKVAPEYRDVWWAIRACGENLDAPDYIVSGSTVYSTLIRESFSPLSYRR